MCVCYKYNNYNLSIIIIIIIVQARSQTSEKGRAKLWYQGYDEGEDARMEAE